MKWTKCSSNFTSLGSILYLITTPSREGIYLSSSYKRTLCNVVSISSLRCSLFEYAVKMLFSVFNLNTVQVWSSDTILTVSIRQWLTVLGYAFCINQMQFMILYNNIIRFDISMGKLCILQLGKDVVKLLCIILWKFSLFHSLINRHCRLLVDEIIFTFKI